MQKLGPFRIDVKSREIRDGSRTVRLSPIQAEILRLLCQAGGKVVSKKKFHNDIWKANVVGDGSLTQNIFLLRKALGKLPDGSEFVQTVPRKGYKLSTRAVEPDAFRPVTTSGSDRHVGGKGDEPYRLLVESIEDYAIYMLDCSGRVMTWNRGAELSKGFGSAEVLGQHYSLFFLPDDIEARVPERELAAAAARGHCSGESWRIRKNGERFWASFVLTALRDSTGKLVGFAKVLKDLTEQKRREDTLKRVEASLRRERDRLIAVAETSMDALYICEPVRNPEGQIEDFVFTYANSCAERLAAKPRDLLLGSRTRDLIFLNSELGIVDAFKVVAETGKPLMRDLPIQATHLGMEWVLLRAVRLDGGIAITAADITQNKRTEARLLKLTQANAGNSQ